MSRKWYWYQSWPLVIVLLVGCAYLVPGAWEAEAARFRP